jgi:hypothetical protein
MKKLIFFYLSTILMFAFLTSCESTDYSKVGSIYGIVTKEGSTEPISAIPVSLYKDNNLLLQTITYSDGHFEFSNLLPGNYVIKIDGLGYEYQEYNVIVESLRMARADMQLKIQSSHMSVITYVTRNKKNEIVLTMDVNWDNGYKYNELGYYYSKDSNPIENGTRLKISSYNDDYILENLEPGFYYVVAYAKNEFGVSYGEVLMFEIKEATSEFEFGGKKYQVSKDLGATEWEEAISLCNNLSYNGYTDWYLPTKSELNSMFENQYEIGGFSWGGRYWSSTEESSSEAWYHSFDGYGSNYWYKYNTYRVRCVRKE